jgi:hypothetical protein
VADARVTRIGMLTGDCATGLTDELTLTSDGGGATDNADVSDSAVTGTGTSKTCELGGAAGGMEDTGGAMAIRNAGTAAPALLLYNSTPK